MLHRIEMYGCPFDTVNIPSALQVIKGFIQDGDRPYQAIGVNLHHMRLIQQDVEFKHTVTSCDLILPDGISMVWCSLLQPVRLKQRVAISDLLTPLLDLSAREGYKIFMLGAKEESLVGAIANIERDHPGIQIVGSQNGYFDQEDEPGITKQIANSGADILFIGITSPKKEQFVERNRYALSVSFVMGVGGMFDVLSGFTVRAPLLVQKVGMEWFWRCLQEPRRIIPRCVVDLAFTRYIARDVRARLKRHLRARLGSRAG